MERFFQWCSELTTAQAMTLLGFFALVMLLIPFGSIIYAFIQYVIFPKPLQIHSFRYHFVESLSDLENPDSKDASPDFIVKGSVLLISWEVTGAWRIDIEPIGRNLKGNAASIIFDPNCLQFTLKAHRFFSPAQVAVLNIPQSSCYRLENVRISDFSIASAPLVSPQNISFIKSISNTLAFTLTRLLNKKLIVKSKKIQPDVGSIGTLKEFTGTATQKKFYRMLHEQKVMRFYSFSTQKYPNTLN